MNIKKLNEELEKFLENHISIDELKPTKNPTVFDIVKGGKKIGYVEFPELESDVEDAILDVEEDFFNRGEYEDEEFDPIIEDIKILKVKILDFDEESCELAVKYSAMVNNQPDLNTHEVISEPKIVMG